MLKRIRFKIYGWKNQPGKAEVERMVTEFDEKAPDLTFSETVSLLGRDFKRLINISRYAENGEAKAISLAYRMGYVAGEASQQE